MMTTKEGAEQQKTAATRLLDLLAGWSEFVANDEESGVKDPSLTSEEIGDLYQAAGAQSLQWDSLSVDDEDRAVREFVETRVLPLLTRRWAAVPQRVAA